MAMQVVHKIPAAHDTIISAVAFDQTRGIVFVGAEHPDIRAWSTSSPENQPLAVMKAHKGFVTSLSFCEGISVLFSGSVDGQCILWDDRFKPLQVCQGNLPCLLHRHESTEIACSESKEADSPLCSCMHDNRTAERAVLLSFSASLRDQNLLNTFSFATSLSSLCSLCDSLAFLEYSAYICAIALLTHLVWKVLRYCTHFDVQSICSGA
jgi:WD40 repeat protein